MFFYLRLNFCFDQDNQTSLVYMLTYNIGTAYYLIVYYISLASTLLINL